MDCFSTTSVGENLLTPVKSSVKRISQGGTKVWDSLTRRRRIQNPPIISEVIQTQFSQSLTIQIPRDTADFETHSIIRSYLSLASSIDQKHYTCLSPTDLAEITGRIQRLTVNPGPSRSSRYFPGSSCSLTYEQFENGAAGMMGSETVIDDAKLYRTKLLNGTSIQQPLLIKVDKANQQSLKVAPSSKKSSNEDLMMIDVEKLVDDLVSDETDDHKIEEAPPNQSPNPQKSSITDLDHLRSELEAFREMPSFEQDIFKSIYDLLKTETPEPGESVMRKKLISEKFVINVYDSPRRRKTRFSTLFRTNSVSLETPVGVVRHSASFMDERPCEYKSVESINALITDFENEGNTSRGNVGEQTRLEALAMRRNLECSNIKGLSQALRLLRSDCDSRIDILLYAERCLLLSSEKCDLYKELLAMKDSQPVAPEVTATLTISNISIPLNSEIGHYSDTYFICTLCSGEIVLATKYIQPLIGPLGKKYISFDEELIFEGISLGFKLHIKVYYLHLSFNRAKTGLRKLLPKKALGHAVKYYCYENLLTTENEKGYYLLPVFKQCALFEITMGNFHHTKYFNLYSGHPYFCNSASVTKVLRNHELNVRMKGLLNFGKVHRDNLLIWNIKYVTLVESELKIFDSPEDAEDDKAIVKIDLKNLANKLITKCFHMRFSFQLDIHECRGTELASTYSCFLRANTKSEFLRWTKELNNAIRKLKDWNLLSYYSEEI